MPNLAQALEVFWASYSQSGTLGFAKKQLDYRQWLLPIASIMPV